MFGCFDQAGLERSLGARDGARDDERAEFASERFVQSISDMHPVAEVVAYFLVSAALAHEKSCVGASRVLVMS